MSVVHVNECLYYKRVNFIDKISAFHQDKQNCPLCWSVCIKRMSIILILEFNMDRTTLKSAEQPENRNMSISKALNSSVILEEM